jgi:hypothetical protein
MKVRKKKGYEMKTAIITWNPETLVDANGWDGIDRDASIERYEKQVVEELDRYENVEFRHSHVDKSSFIFIDNKGSSDTDDDSKNENAEYAMQEVFSRFDWAVDK